MLENAPSTALRNLPRYARLGNKFHWMAANMADTVVDGVTGRTFYSHMYHDPQPQTVLHITQEADLNNIALACDSDYGGSSRIDLDLSPDLGDGSERWAVCKGRISLAVRKEVQGKVRGGWVGFRTIKAPADPWVMTPTRNIEPLTHLSILVRPKGDPHLWPHWFVNLKSASTYFEEDIHSHRLGITGSGELGDGWEECLVPLWNLAHLRAGEITNKQEQPSLDRMTTIGFSLLGAPRNFQLDIGPVRAIYQHIHFHIPGLPPVYRFPPSLAHFQAQINPPPPLPPVLYPNFGESYYRDALQPTYERGSYPPYNGLPGVEGTYVDGLSSKDGNGDGEGKEGGSGSTGAGQRWSSGRKAALSEEGTRRALEEL